MSRQRTGYLRGFPERLVEAMELPGKIAEDVYQPTREDLYKKIELYISLLRQMDLFEIRRRS